MGIQKAQKKRVDSVTSRSNLLEQFRDGTSVPELAKRIGCEPSSWYKWERGDSFPTLPFIWRIENLFSARIGRPISFREIWPEANPSLDDLVS